MNYHDIPDPDQTTEGRSKINAESSPLSPAKQAKKYRPKGADLEPPVSTIARFAGRLIDRLTGKAYSADEIAANNANVASAINGGGEIADPADGDRIAMIEEGVSSSTKWITFENLWTWVKSKLDGVLTIAGAKTLSGQLELTGQLATNPTSAMTRALVDARGGRTVSAVLATDESGNINTATLKTSSTLSLPLEAGTWDVEALIIVNCNSLTAGSRQKLHFTGTYSSFGGVVYGVDNGTAASTVYPTSRATVSAVDYERVASGSSIATLRIGRIVVTAAGNITAQFAQQAATAATSPTLVAGSFIRATKVA